MSPRTWSITSHYIGNLIILISGYFEIIDVTCIYPAELDIIRTNDSVSDKFVT